MTTTGDLPRLAPSRTLVRGTLLGAVCGVVGGLLAIVVGAVISAFVGSLEVLVFALYALIPAAFVGGVVGAAAGFVSAALAVVALEAAARLPRPTERAGRTAASVGAALGSAGALVAVGMLYAPLRDLAWVWVVTLIVAPITAGVAARIAWTSLDEPSADDPVSARERWSWRLLLVGFALGTAAFAQSIVLIADPYWRGWGGQPDSGAPVQGLMALIVVASVAAPLLVVGVRFTPNRTTGTVVAALGVVGALFLAASLGIAGLAPMEDRAGSAPSFPAEPALPDLQEAPPAEVVEPAPPEEATTLFTLADITAAGQAQVDGTIAVVGPIDDPAIPAGTTTFPVFIGGCGNLAGGAVSFEVWFLVDDLPGGFARVRDEWLAQGFTLDEPKSSAHVVATGGADSAIRGMSLEDKDGTVRFVVQSACVAGDDY
ncbi:hypothetical protein [Conyzicola sp.]|uniref:hypothetical protein n=1 Tax=Conyzicola sp. TaxID=1969404 RepID=UPI0039892629